MRPTLSIAGTLMLLTGLGICFAYLTFSLAGRVDFGAAHDAVALVGLPLAAAGALCAVATGQLRAVATATLRR